MTRAWWDYYDDEGPYPGWTPDGPTQIHIDVEAYRRMGFDPLEIRCSCGFTSHQTKIYVCSLDRWRPPQYFCAVCMPDKWRWVRSDP